MMKKQNGFTLVELLAVIALLGILGAIATTSAINISRKLKEDMLCEKLDFIANAAKTYGSDIFDDLSENPDIKKEVTIRTLVDKGYLKKDQDKEEGFIINPLDDSIMDSIKVQIYRKNNRAYAHIDTAAAGMDTSFCD